jgi:hypothetical protein
MESKDITEVMKPGSTRTPSEARATAATRTLANCMNTSNNRIYRNDKNALHCKLNSRKSLIS